MAGYPQLTARWLCLVFLLLIAMQQGRSSNPDMMTVVFPPLTAVQSKSLIVFCTVLDTSYTATVIDNRTSINFQFTLVAFGTFRRLMTASYREMSFSVFPLAQGFHVFAKWGIAIANTDAFSVFTDDMLGTDYVISTWTDCCNATAFVLVSALDVSSTTVSITLPASFSSTVSADGQTYSSDFTLQLGLREVITMTSTADLTGTRITSSDATLVQSGSNTAAVQGTTTGQLIEALPPLTNQGTLHFGLPTTGRSADVYRLVGSTSSNTVTIQEDGILSVTITLTSSNPVYDYVATQPIIITSSDALLVTQYSSSDDGAGVPPAMTFIPSSDHWASYYVIKEVDGSLTRPEYVSLVIPTSYTSGVRMTYNDQTQVSVTGWSTFQSDATYSYVTLFITQTFLLDHDSGQVFMVLQYGATANWAYSFVPVFTRTPVTSTSTMTAASATTAPATSQTTAVSPSTSTAPASSSSISAATSVASSSSSSSSQAVTSNNNSTSFSVNANGTDSSSSSSSSWLDDPTNQLIVAIGVTVPVVAVVSFVVWRALATPVAEVAAAFYSSAASAATTTKTMTSTLVTDATSSSAPPASSQLPPAEKKGLPKVD